MTVDLKGMIQSVHDARYLEQRQERAEQVFAHLVAELEKLKTELKIRKELELLVQREHAGLVGLAWVHRWRPDPELVKKADALRAALGETS